MIEGNRIDSKNKFSLKRTSVGFVMMCVATLTAVSLTMVSIRLLSVSRAHADTSVNTQTAITVTSSCEMTAVVDTAHETTVSASTYADDIGQTTITVACNDANGYAVYAVGFTNNEMGRNDLLGQTTGRVIATGTATSGDTSAWAMKLAAVENSVAPTIETGYSAYHAVPDEYTKVVSYADSTMENPAGSSFKTTYATYVDNMQAPDTYLGKVKYTLVHPADTTNTPCTGNYTIIYNRNGGTGSMDSQTACVDRTIGLLPNGFTPPAPVDESQFAVWNTEADGSGYTYYPGQSVANLASSGGSVTLYAQWAPKYIQDMTASKCQVVANENPFTVYDKRDGNDYTIRYIEGACWMTQNLRITGTVNAQYSNFSTYSNVDVCEQDLTVNGSYDYTGCYDSGNTTNGVWYNYASTSAKTITGNSNNMVATEDICPANWRLPSNDANNAAGSFNSLLASLLKFTPVTGGYYYGGSDSPSYTDQGNWWSSAAYSGMYRYYLEYNGSSLRIAYGNGFRSTGRYIRCVRV